MESTVSLAPWLSARRRRRSRQRAEAEGQSPADPVAESLPQKRRRTATRGATQASVFAGAAKKNEIDCDRDGKEKYKDENDPWGCDDPCAEVTQASPPPSPLLWVSPSVPSFLPLPQRDYSQPRADHCRLQPRAAALDADGLLRVCATRPGWLVRRCSRDGGLAQRCALTTEALRGDPGPIGLALPRVTLLELALLWHARSKATETTTTTPKDAEDDVVGTMVTDTADWVERCMLAAWYDWVTGDVPTLHEGRLHDEGLALARRTLLAQSVVRSRTVAFGTMSCPGPSCVAAMVARVSTHDEIVEPAHQSGDGDDADSQDELVPPMHDDLACVHDRLVGAVYEHSSFMRLDDLRLWTLQPESQLLLLHDTAVFGSRQRRRLRQDLPSLSRCAVLAWEGASDTSLKVPSVPRHQLARWGGVFLKSGRDAGTEDRGEADTERHLRDAETFDVVQTLGVCEVMKMGAVDVSVPEFLALPAAEAAKRIDPEALLAAVETRVDEAVCARLPTITLRVDGRLVRDCERSWSSLPVLLRESLWASDDKWRITHMLAPEWCVPVAGPHAWRLLCRLSPKP